MNRYDRWTITMAVALAGTLSLAPSALAAGLVDRVRTSRGSETGEVVGMSPLEVTLDKAGSASRKIAVNEIRSVAFDGEPAELTQARLHVRNGGYATALDTLRTIDSANVARDMVRQDVEFYQALCAAKLALGGDGEIAAAGSQLNGFVRQHPRSFHYLEAVETMGDLLMASGKYAAAQKQYAELAKAPWPDFKLRTGVLIGRTLQVQGKHDEAIRQFDNVLETNDDSQAARNQKLSATLGKAESLAHTDRMDDALRLIEDVIQGADPEQNELQARAYNALGECYERAGRSKDALLAYLHVDVLYNMVPDAHAQALTQMIPLWEGIGQEARAREARQVLQERYGGRAPTR